MDDNTDNALWDLVQEIYDMQQVALAEEPATVIPELEYVRNTLIRILEDSNADLFEGASS